MRSSGSASRRAALAVLFLLVAGCGVRPNTLRAPAPAAPAPSPAQPTGPVPSPGSAGIDGADAGL